MPPVTVRVRPATVEDNRAVIAVCKQSPYTRDFTNIIFSGPDCYAAGRIKVACRGRTVMGFSCFRRRVRDGVTVLYFVGVNSADRGRGVGTLLMDDLHALADGPVELKVMKDNPAVRLYERLGYVRTGEAYDGKAWVMRWEKEKPPGLPGGGKGPVILGRRIKPSPPRLSPSR